MPAITIGTYRGALPRVDPRLLPEQNASRAVDCKYDHGNLEPLKALKPVSAAIKSNTKTLFHYLDNHWFSWAEDVHAVRSPIPKDPYQRVYFTGTDCPRFTKQDIAIGSTMPNASIPLGIPKPGGTIIASSSTSGSDIADVTNDESRFYVFTWVSDLGEEGPPSDPSNMVTVDEPTSRVSLTLPVSVQTIEVLRLDVYTGLPRLAMYQIGFWLLSCQLQLRPTPTKKAGRSYQSCWPRQIISHRPPLCRA